jgi:dihydroorotate dehydrogenase electron transfer subunit
MRKESYAIVSNACVADGVFEMRIAAPEMAAGATPGQFVNLYLPGGAMLLPRPISIAGADADEGAATDPSAGAATDADAGTVTLTYAVVGAGTAALAAMRAGETVDALGPLGIGFFDYHGFVLPRRVLLIGGGVGIPPLRFAAKWLRGQAGGGGDSAGGAAPRIDAFLGFRAEPWYLAEFEAVCDQVHASSDTAGAAPFHGNVVDLLNARCADLTSNEPTEAGGEPAGESADARHSGSSDGSAAEGNVGSDILALACGPRPMLAAAAAWCAARGIPLRTSLEERMGCGYGACAACTCRMRAVPHLPTEGPKPQTPDGTVRKKVCAHGPVFWGEEVVW